MDQIPAEREGSRVWNGEWLSRSTLCSLHAAGSDGISQWLENVKQYIYLYTQCFHVLCWGRKQLHRKKGLTGRDPFGYSPWNCAPLGAPTFAWALPGVPNWLLVAETHTGLHHTGNGGTRSPPSPGGTSGPQHLPCAPKFGVGGDVLGVANAIPSWSWDAGTIPDFIPAGCFYS